MAEPVNLDPAQVTDLNANGVGRRIIETLVTFPDESTQVVRGLAESWTVSKDGPLHLHAPSPGRHAVEGGGPTTKAAMRRCRRRRGDRG